MKILYREFINEDSKPLKKLVNEFYEEDPLLYNYLNMNIDRTILSYQNHPDWGVIWIFENNGIIIGHSIVNKYWSNEYGGLILFIDELFITFKYRLKKIAFNFIIFLINSLNDIYVGIQLEVRKKNKSIIQFYQKLGFNFENSIILFKYLK